MPRRTGGWWLFACVLPALLIAGGAGAEREPARVAMYDNVFDPPLLAIPVGGKVEFRNAGRNPHNAVADDASWSTETSYGELAMPAKARATVAFEKAGVYPYYCTYHGTPGGVGMAGVIVVGDARYEPPGGPPPAPVEGPSGKTRHVPADYPTIQSAVDAAAPGDLVLIERGVYREEVLVTTPSLVIRGADRNETILDGEFVRGNGIIVLADGVAIENLTARNAQLNGFFWTGVTGYRGSYLTAYNNGDYGVYAFDSTDGLFEHSYASGNPDSGFYVGQCHPCRMLIRSVVSENNALGYSGTNSGGDLYLASSVWRNNMAGIVPNTLDTELLPPERETTLVANLVIGNNNAQAPAQPGMTASLGTGILIVGGLRNVVERNLVIGHRRHGILVSPNHDQNFWPAHDNRIRDNRVLHSTRADLALAGPYSTGNCFAGNEHATSAPPGLEALHGCDGLRLPLGWDLVPGASMLFRLRRAQQPGFAVADYRTQPEPPPQAPMPGGAGAPVRPAFAVFDGLRFDPAQAELPPEAAAFAGDFDAATLPKEARVPAPGFAGLVFGRATYYLPALALALGVLLSLSGRRRAAVWTVAAGLVLRLAIVVLGGWLLSL